MAEAAAKAIPVLMLPGLGNSGPDHWQTLWEKQNPEFRRIEQADWVEPNPEDWIFKIDHYVRSCPVPPIVVAHSLGCIALARWVARGARLHAALLVAPADVEQADVPHSVAEFAPIPLTSFPFPTIVVASSNDIWCTKERARVFAAHWAGELVWAGPCGHLNSDSGFGQWPEGERLLRRLRN